IRTVAMANSEYTTTYYDYHNAQALDALVREHGVQLHTLSDEIVAGLADATRQIVGELLADSDPLVREVMASYAKFRNQTAEYARHSYAPNMNVRDFAFPES